MAAFLFQRLTIYGDAVVSVYQDFYVQDLSENHSDILNGAITIDDATLSQAPKLRELMNGSLKIKDSPYGSSVASQISIFDYNVIKTISENNPLGAERLRQSNSHVVNYDGQYYGVIIIKR
ncbi:hypothetical protein [Candidatus Nitrososphaera gargensis]|uniref:hypothetical protein n=1 Tax=Candidatus Nitrososphaera gargensis TaxID=497727 RepID=UPI0011E53EE0|nr:hypothetical protein [Candidatus Nitrososphaera gargensis]